MAKPKGLAIFRNRQIFKFGLLIKKENKKKLKIRLVLNRTDSVTKLPYCSYTQPLPNINQKTVEIEI